MRSDFPTSVSLLPVPDYKAVFEATLSPYLLLALDFNIIAVNEAYLGATHALRAALLGRNIFEVFASSNQDTSESFTPKLRQSLDRVLREHVIDLMAIHKHGIVCPVTGLVQERFWSPVNKPVFAADGSLLYIIHRVEDVTEIVQGQSWSPEMGVDVYQRSQDVQAIHRELKLAKDNLERLAARRTLELALSEEKFRLMANTMPQIVWTARSDGTVDWCNDCWYKFTGLPRGRPRVDCGRKAIRNPSSP